jgi:DNA mismatch endonuclease, patch repair protein
MRYRRAAYRPKPPEEVRRNMSAIRSKENSTEVELRRRLHREGLRFRKYRRDLPGVPDLVFVRERIAVFVDGDFWHGRMLVNEGVAALRRSIRSPNHPYWVAKLVGNVRRDRDATRKLNEDGWLVLRLWESDVKANMDWAVRRVIRAVIKRREGVRKSRGRE